MIKQINYNFLYQIFGIMIVLSCPKISISQCGISLTEPDCNIPGSIEIFEGATIGPSQTFVVTSTSDLNTITVNGGSLIICGQLNINTLNFNTGTIIVTSQGFLNMTNPGIAVVFGNACNLINFGLIVSQSSIVTGPNNLIYNYSITSSINIPFNQMVVQGPNSQVINNGFFNSNFIINLSNNSISPFCLGPGSVTSTGILINQFPNGFFSPQSNSCLSISNTIMNSQVLTDSNNTIVCYDAGIVSLIGNPLFGQAVVNNTCSSCSISLGPESIELKAEQADGSIEIEISLSSIENIYTLHLEKLDEPNLGDFIPICQFDPSSSIYQDRIVYLDNAVVNGEIYYYRVFIVNNNGESLYSDIVSIKYTNEGMKIYPNPSMNSEFQLADKVEIFSVKDLNGLIYQFDIVNKKMKIQEIANTNIFFVSGIFNGECFTEKLIVTDFTDK